MKKSALSLFIVSQCLLVSGTAFAANFSTPNNPNKSFENTLAQTVTTIAQDKQDAPAVLASNYSSNALTHYLNQYGHASVSLNFGEKGHLDSADVNFLKPIKNTRKNVFFYQLSYHRPDQRNIFSAGLGDRRFFDHQKALYGVDGFVDADTKGNVRASVGGELYFNYARFDANYYVPLSQWKHINGTEYDQARPARGFDVRFKGYLPQYPALSTTLDYSKYYGQVGVFNADTRENNPSVFSYGITYRPIQLVSFSAQRQQATGDQSQNTFGLNLHYQLGVPFHDQLHAMPTTYGQLGEERYAFVQRNYTMPMAYREIDHLSVTLHGATITNGSEVFPHIDANHKIVSVHWSGPWAKYLNSDSTMDPTFTHLPKDMPEGALTVTVIDSEGKEASSTATFTQAIGNDTHVVNALKMSVSSNNEAYANVTGTTAPNTKVTITFPDGTTQVVTSNSKGVFTDTSKYAWIQKGKITATAGKLTATEVFTPTPVGRYVQVLGRMVFGCFTYAMFDAPNGSTVHLQFSNSVATSGKVLKDNQVSLFPGYSYLPSGTIKAYLVTNGHKSGVISVGFTQNFAPGVGITKVVPEGNNQYQIDYWAAPSAISYNVNFNLDGGKISVHQSAQSPAILGVPQKEYHTWEAFKGEKSLIVSHSITVTVPNKITTANIPLVITSSTASGLKSILTASISAKLGTNTANMGTSTFSGQSPLKYPFQGDSAITNLISQPNA